MPRLSQSSWNVTEVTIQHWPQIRKCQYYCSQHTSSLSQSEAHCTVATVNEQTKSKPERMLTVLSSFSCYVSTTNCAGNVVGCSCHIFQLNCNINSKWQFFSCAIVAFSERYNFTVCCRPCAYSAVHFPVLSHTFPLMPYWMYILKPYVT